MLLSYRMGYSLQYKVLQPLRIWTSLKYFLLGGLMSPMLTKIERIDMHIHTLLLIMMSAFSVAYQYVAGKYLLNNIYAESFYDSIVVTLWSMVLFSWVLRLQIKSEKAVRVIGGVGNCTTGIYIIHIFLIPINPFGVIQNTVLRCLFHYVFVFLGSLGIVWILKKIPFIKEVV